MNLGEDSQTLDKARAAIKKLELTEPIKPSNSDVVWPNNVADLDPNALAEHMTNWSGLSSYARYHLAMCETNLAAFEEQHKLTVNLFILKSHGDYKTVTEAKAAAHESTDTQQEWANVLTAKATVRLLKALLEGYELRYQTISREITRRNSEWNEGGRHV